jgi:hypothetical protein
MRLGRGWVPVWMCENEENPLGLLLFNGVKSVYDEQTGSYK